MRVKNRIVLITGASYGIGAALAKLVSKLGAHTVVLARSGDRLDRLVEEIKGEGGVAHAFAVDLADDAAVAATAERIKTEVGIPDIIINNAGAGRFVPIEETTPEENRQMLAVPYFAAFNITRAFIKEMLARNSGQIVNLTSVNAFVSLPKTLGYSVARGAMRAFNDGLRADFRKTRLTTTLIVPGLVSSHYLDANAGVREFLAKIKGLRWKTPEQLAVGAVKAIERDRRMFVDDPKLRFLILLQRLWPSLVRWVVGITDRSDAK